MNTEICVKKSIRRSKESTGNKKVGVGDKMLSDTGRGVKEWVTEGHE